MSLTAEQLEQRTRGIGGSDVAALMGTSPWSTPRDVWLEKRGLTERAESEAMYWGTALEYPILARYASDHSDVSVVQNSATLFHRQYTWALATPDAIAQIIGDMWGVEVKTANAFAGKQWDDGVPAYYVAQCQWYMFVLDVARWDVAVLIGGSDYREFTIERDDEAIRHLFNAAEKFYREHMLPVSCPEPSSPAEWSKTPVKDDVILWANADQEDAALGYLVLAEQVNLAQETLTEQKATLQSYIGEHSGLEGPGFKITWRQSGKSRRFVAKRKEATV